MGETCLKTQPLFWKNQLTKSWKNQTEKPKTQPVFWKIAISFRSSKKLLWRGWIFFDLEKFMSSHHRYTNDWRMRNGCVLYAWDFFYEFFFILRQSHHSFSIKKCARLFVIKLSLINFFRGPLLLYHAYM